MIEGGEEGAIRDQDRLLPIANISRIMKRVLPDHAKMSKESKSSIQESVSEFIGFITSEASDRLLEDKRKTITGDDIIDSMRALGFDNYIEFLQIYLRKYRASVKGTRQATGGDDREKSVSHHDHGRDRDRDRDRESEHGGGGQHHRSRSTSPRRRSRNNDNGSDSDSESFDSNDHHDSDDEDDGDQDEDRYSGTKKRKL